MQQSDNEIDKQIEMIKLAILDLSVLSERFLEDYKKAVGEGNDTEHYKVAVETLEEFIKTCKTNCEKL